MIFLSLVTSRDETIENLEFHSPILVDVEAKLNVRNTSGNPLLVTVAVGQRDMLGNTPYQLRYLRVLSKDEVVTFPERGNLDLAEGVQTVTVTAYELGDSLYRTVPDTGRLPNGSRLSVESLRDYLQKVSQKDFAILMAEPAIA